MEKKIVLIGRASVGKTSLIKSIFEGEDAQKLILYPLEPTRGINNYTFAWMDLKLGVFDTSGQELPFILFEKKDQNIAFDRATAIIYIMDFCSWILEQQDIIEEIKSIFDIKEIREKEAKFYIIFHKIDLIHKTNHLFLKNFEYQIRSELKLPSEIKIFFTSLYPSLIYSAFNAFSEILSEFSQETAILKRILDKNGQNLSKTICFITNKNNSVIAQSMSNDFDPTLIHALQKFSSQIDHSFESLESFCNGVNIIDSGSKIFDFTMTDLSKYNQNLKYLLLFSESFDRNSLLQLKNSTQNEIKNHYKLKK